MFLKLSYFCQKIIKVTAQSPWSKYIYKSMTEILKKEPCGEGFLQQTIEQQQTLIAVLKQEIIRLQVLVIDAERQRDQKNKLYEQALEEIENLKEKIESLKENNQSIMHTFKVFQREFVKRDYKLTENNSEIRLTSDGPLFFELIRTMKSKLGQSSPQPSSFTQKSHLSEYYGYFFFEDIQQNQNQLYKEATQHKKSKALRIKSYGKKNYFNEKYRHFFWFKISDNILKISHKQYQILLGLFDSNQQNQNRKTSIIDLDLKRMDLKLDSQKGESMKIQIKRCLEIFKLYRPDVGYVQGMSYLAWMLLIRMEGYQSFVCFANMILCDPFIYSLYFFKPEKLKKIISFFYQCLKDKKPKLYKHIKNLMVQPELFIIQWAYTFFSRAFSLRVSSKIWDLWFCEGFNVFFKVLMVIFQMLEGQILQQNENDKIIELLRTRTHKLDEVELLKNLQKQKLFEDLKL